MCPFFMPKEWFTSVGNNADTYNLDSIKDTLVHDDRDSANHVEIIPYRIHHGTSGGHNLWTLKEEMINISVVPVKMIKCPVGLFDKPIGETKRRLFRDAPVMERDATWSAANRALGNLIPIPDSDIIFDYSRTNRQINNKGECLFTGYCLIKDKKGEYVDAYFHITVKYTGGYAYEPEHWVCYAVLAF